jgi:hypothetical protein
MTQEPTPKKPERNSQQAWAKPIDRMKVGQVPTGATNLNIDGREVMSPMQGFGPLWQKTYRVRLAGANVTPQQVVQVWKERFPEFQPADNRFIPALAGVQPGEVLFISATVPTIPGLKVGIPVSAGVMVLYADDEMFTVMTPAGFPEAGWNTFSAFEEDGVTVAQVQSMGRSNDPIYEFGFRFMGGARHQEETWAHVLTSLAKHFGVHGTVTTQLNCLDSKLQWGQARNVFQNAMIHTMLYKLAAPFRWLRRPAAR